MASPDLEDQITQLKLAVHEVADAVRLLAIEARDTTKGAAPYNAITKLDNAIRRL